MPALSGIHHVKLPVRDVVRSREWYEAVLGLEVEIEFVEDGALRGVALREPGGTLRLALREEPDRAAALAGFDPVSLEVETHADLKAWAAHLDDLDLPHGGVVRGHQGWALVGLGDPDGLQVRLYTRERHDGGCVMSLDPRGHALAAGEGEPWWFLDCRMTLKVTGEETGGAFTLLEWEAPTGFGPPRHVHDREDEVFHVLEGEMRVECADRSWEVGPGGTVFLPRGVEHCFVVTAGPVRGLQVTAPSQFEEYVRRVGRPPQHAGLPEPSQPDVPALVAVTEELGMRLVGPPMTLDAGPAPTPG